MVLHENIQKFTQKDTCMDTIKLAAKSDVDNELRQSLIDPDHGILNQVACPKCKQLRKRVLSNSLMLWARHHPMKSPKHFWYLDRSLGSFVFLFPIPIIPRNMWYLERSVWQYFGPKLFLVFPIPISPINIGYLERSIWITLDSSCSCVPHFHHSYYSSTWTGLWFFCGGSSQETCSEAEGFKGHPWRDAAKDLPGKGRMSLGWILEGVWGGQATQPYPFKSRVCRWAGPEALDPCPDHGKKLSQNLGGIERQKLPGQNLWEDLGEDGREDAWAWKAGGQTIPRPTATMIHSHPTAINSYYFTWGYSHLKNTIGDIP